VNDEKAAAKALTVNDPLRGYPVPHRPGTRSARWERCLSSVLQAKRKDVMLRHSFAASVALRVLAVLAAPTPLARAQTKLIHTWPYHGCQNF
jgi:hypothetical protein